MVRRNGYGLTLSSYEYDVNGPQFISQFQQHVMNLEGNNLDTAVLTDGWGGQYKIKIICVSDEHAENENHVLVIPQHGISQNVFDSRAVNVHGESDSAYTVHVHFADGSECALTDPSCATETASKPRLWLYLSNNTSHTVKVTY